MAKLATLTTNLWGPFLRGRADHVVCATLFRYVNLCYSYNTIFPVFGFSRFLEPTVVRREYARSLQPRARRGFFWSWKCQIDQKVPKPEGLRCFYHLRHYTTLHYTTLHYTTLHHMYLSIDNTKNVLTAAGHRKLFLRV